MFDATKTSKKYSFVARSCAINYYCLTLQSNSGLSPSNNNQIEMMRKAVFTLMMICLTVANAADKFVTFTKDGASLAIAKDGKVLDIISDINDYEGVRMALNNLQNDFRLVCGTAPAIGQQLQNECIIIGSIGLKSSATHWLSVIVLMGKPLALAKTYFVSYKCFA